MIEGYKLVQIPSTGDERGQLSFVEYGQVLDFQVNRVYWLYDLKKERGAHAHKKLKQFMFCSNGSLDLVLSDGENSVTISLDSPNKGIIISKPLWRDITNFKNNPCLVVLASNKYDESDYIRSFEEFKSWKSRF
ncbi:MAG: FdtA/QdtA family cupin domain-containing protein [Rickettsiales bacterium]|nr:FdtA/QdtA family cupin domain-containing protein [Rickettsiales bacterium]MCA0253942.1 FdtA/QdtA family cupin domain-containing protein [Pseudomonadota bacterium]